MTAKDKINKKWILGNKRQRNSEQELVENTVKGRCEKKKAESKKILEE